MKGTCKKHGLTEFSNGIRPRCRRCMVVAVSKRRKKIKVMAIEYKGSKCSICGYNKCVDALDFHHLDKTKKDFNLSAEGHTRSWSRVKQELDKCILVCSNCHREIHSHEA